jgi:uncharacterized protein
MKIYVVVKTKARADKIEKVDDTTIKVSVHEAPVDGKANEAVIGLLAEYYQVHKNQIHQLSGKTLKHKYFDINK